MSLLLSILVMTALSSIRGVEGIAGPLKFNQKTVAAPPTEYWNNDAVLVSSTTTSQVSGDLQRIWVLLPRGGGGSLVEFNHIPFLNKKEREKSFYGLPRMER